MLWGCGWGYGGLCASGSMIVTATAAARSARVTKTPNFCPHCAPSDNATLLMCMMWLWCHNHSLYQKAFYEFTSEELSSVGLHNEAALRSERILT